MEGTHIRTATIYPAAINTELAGLYTRFSQNLLADENTWIELSDADLAGLPEGLQDEQLGLPDHGPEVRLLRCRLLHEALQGLQLRGIGPNYIDTYIVKSGGTYHAFSKNETTKYIEHATATSLTGPYTWVGTGNWAGWGSGLEGPALVRLPDHRWRIYFDNYSAR